MMKQKAEQELKGEAIQKPKKSSEEWFTMTLQILKFVGYDWIFLIYSCIFIISIIFDVVALIVGANDKTGCAGMVGNILSFIVHFFIWIMLCCMLSCIFMQIQCNEIGFMKPIIKFLTCGAVDPEKREE